ncbi:MAG: endonuclease [Planktomarina sp.]
MTQQKQADNCMSRLIGYAVGAGILMALFALFICGYSWLGAIISGLIAAAIVAALFYFVFCNGQPATGSAIKSETGKAAATATATGEPAAKVAAEPKAEPKAEVKPSAVATTTPAPKATTTAAAKKPAAKNAAPKKAAATKTVPAKPAVAAPADDGSVNDAFKPSTLKKARAGGADDLKLIKGVGPKMEGVCNKLGFYHFDQIAGWSKDELTWVDANLDGFKGRASRDEWVAQAKILAAGGETEFSAKKTKK